MYYMIVNLVAASRFFPLLDGELPLQVKITREKASVQKKSPI